MASTTTVAAKRVARRLADRELTNLILSSKPLTSTPTTTQVGSTNIIPNSSSNPSTNPISGTTASLIQLHPHHHNATLPHHHHKNTPYRLVSGNSCTTSGNTTVVNGSRCTSPIPTTSTHHASPLLHLHTASKRTVLERLPSNNGPTSNPSTTNQLPSSATHSSASFSYRWSTAGSSSGSSTSSPSTSTSNYHTFAGNSKIVAPSSSQSHSSSSSNSASSSSFGLSTSSAAACLQASYHTRSISLPVASLGNSNDGVPWFDKQSASSIFELFEKVKSIPQARRTFRFTHAASAMPKSSHHSITNDSRYQSIGAGEDAFFSRHDSMGVADGVGGWTHVKGANPALYSRKLMHYASLELEKYDDIVNNEFDMEEYYNVDPKVILQKSYEAVQRDAAKEGLVGSTTALIVVLRDDELRITNLGDCGVMVIRDNESIFRTEEQQHSFNFPYQLGTGSHDTPDDGQSFKIKVQEGDIVIIGSDGMFDNVFDEEVVDIVRSVTNKVGVSKHNSHDGSRFRLRDIDPQRITDALISRAREIAEDTRFAASPFQSRAIQEGLYYQGGKLDDISVLAGVIRLSEDSPDRR